MLSNHYKTLIRQGVDRDKPHLYFHRGRWCILMAADRGRERDQSDLAHRARNYQLSTLQYKLNQKIGK